MRFTTQLINLVDMMGELSNDYQVLAHEAINNSQYVQFEYDFPSIEDDVEAGNIEISDGDIQVMVELYLQGVTQGEQECFFDTENEEDESTRLTWIVS